MSWFSDLNHSVMTRARKIGRERNNKKKGKNRKLRWGEFSSFYCLCRQISASLPFLPVRFLLPGSHTTSWFLPRWKPTRVQHAHFGCLNGRGGSESRGELHRCIALPYHSSFTKKTKERRRLKALTRYDLMWARSDIVKLSSPTNGRTLLRTTPASACLNVRGSALVHLSFQRH